MWRCSKCGEASPDNFDVCWHCGAHREPGDPTIPDLKSESSEPGKTTGDEMTPSGRPEWAWTPGNLAAVLLRLLGLYLAAAGIVGVVGYVGELIALSGKHGLNDTLTIFYPIHYLMRPGVELILWHLFSHRRTVGVREDFDSHSPPPAGRRVGAAPCEGEGRIRMDLFRVPKAFAGTRRDFLSIVRIAERQWPARWMTKRRSGRSGGARGRLAQAERHGRTEPV